MYNLFRDLGSLKFAATAGSGDAGAPERAMPRLSRTSRRRYYPRGSWFVLLGMAALTLGAPPARGEVLVSNMNQPSAALERVDYGKTEYAEGRITTTIDQVYVPYASQRFGTGSNARGYTLEEFRMDIVDTVGTGAEITVALFADNAGKPGPLLAVLYPEGGFITGTMRFRPRRQSGAYPQLAPNTYYHVEFQQRIGGVYWSITESDLQTGASGWSLYDQGLSFISGSNHDEGLSGVGLLYAAAKGEYGDASPWSPGFPLVLGWTEFPRAFRIEILGSTVTGGAPELAAAYSRVVAENAAPGTAVGDPVTATDSDDDDISYALAGSDGGAFVIDAATGQIRTKTGVFYDYEIKSSYAVTVIADDGNGNTDTAEVTITLTDVEEETLTATIEGAPAEHNGQPFDLELVFSEPAGIGYPTVRDSLLSVTNGQVTQARRLDLDRGLKLAGRHLSARWEVTIEPLGGDVTVTLPATTDCDAADAVCTIDGRRLSAAVPKTVPQGTLPDLTASFAGAPQEHDGSRAFTLELNFNAAVATSPQVMRMHALQVTNGRVTEVSYQNGRRDRWLLTVEPSSLKDVTVALDARSCDDSGAVCAVDGRELSRRAEVGVTGPASIPLTGEGDFYLPMHDRAPFTIGLKFSWAVKITPKAMKTHALRVTNAEIINAYKFGGDSGRHWHIRVLPLSNKTITIDLPRTTDCADPGAVCTRDGRKLSDAYNWLFEPMNPDAVDNTPPALRRAEVDGATLMLLYYEGLDEASTPAANAFAVTVADAPRSLASSAPVTVKGRRVMLTLAAAAAHGETVTVSYTPLGSNPLRDVAGNDAGALSGQAVTNRTAEADNSAPTLQGVAANTDYVMLTYDEVLDEASTPAAKAFTVTVAGAKRDLAANNPVSVSGRTVTLTLASALTDGETVTVSYTVPPSNRLQDVASNHAAALSEQPVSNRSPGSTSRQNSASNVLTAEFRKLPTSHGMELFTFELRFSEEFDLSYLTLRRKAFSVMNGRVTKAQRVNKGSNRRWNITVDPGGGGNVVVTLPAMQDCEAEGAVCAGERPLAEPEMAVVPETPPVVTEDPPAEDPNAPLTVKFEEGSLPATHDGHNPITFRIVFSHEPKSDYGYMTLRNETLSMRLAGRVIYPRRAFKLDPPSGKRWEIVVSQMGDSYVDFDVSDGDLTVSLGPTRDCGDAGAVCTENNERMLSNRISATIRGQPAPALAVADARVREGANAAVELVVSLSRSASEAVTANYATSDFTATVGEDYTGRSGTLTFAAGEKAKTVQVEVLDDSVSERIEWFRLVLSNPSGAGAYLGDASGKGTIWDNEGIPVTASFESMPTNHDGSTEFAFELEFDEEFPVGWRTLQESAFQVTNGQVTAVRRLRPPKSQRWEITVRPASQEAVEITLTPKETCGETGAICTVDGRGLAAPVSETVAGPPPELSVADARVQEAPGATADFAVSLSPAASAPVTVDYATSDGTATAGEDYTEASGTLTFAIGEAAKTVRVAVGDDLHDEGEETFTLTLFNASGNALLSDASATGTIVNTDPLPRAWLARFGRTAAGHVLAAVQERLSGRGQSQATMAGQRLERLDAAAQAAAQEAYEQAWAQGLREGHLQQVPRSVELRELWAGSSFALAAGAAPDAGSVPGAGSAAAGGGGGRWSVWGRGAWSGFTGTDDEVSVDGEVVTGVVGADYEWAALLAGLAVAYSSGSGGYRGAVAGEAEDAGELAAWLVGVHPYVRLTLHERLSVWGLFGYGLLGELELDGDRAAAIGTDLGLVMGAFGARGTLLEAAASGGLEVAARADGLLLRVNTEAATGLAATVAEVTRTRLLLEGSYAVAVLGGMLRPELEAGVRYDGGDAERGAGLVLGGSVSYGLPEWGLSLEASGQGLLRPESWRFSEWGAAGTLRLDPGVPGRGVALSVAPSWGGAAGGGAERLWQLPDAGALAAGGVPAAAAAGRLDAELSYGLEVPGGSGLLTPYAGVDVADSGARTWRAGARVTVAPGLSLGLEGTRSEPSAAVAAEHTFTLNGALRW